MAASSLRAAIPAADWAGFFFGGLDARCSDGDLPTDIRILALDREGTRVLHRLLRARRFTLSEQCAGEAAPRCGFVVVHFLLLKNLESLPDYGFLFGGRTPLFQRQIREGELSFSNRYLVAPWNPHG